jgi:hypothetical protein
MVPKVFISAASRGTARQNDVKATVFSALRAAGLDPRQMNKNEWSFEQPLKAIRNIITECHGIAVLALAQYEIHSVFDIAAEKKQSDPASFRLPTVWNQIEAAIAYDKDLPLLVIAERGVKEEGLMEGRYDWTVYWTDLDPAEFQSEKFLAFVATWKNAVFAHAAASAKGSQDFDLAKLTAGQLISRLTVAQIWACATTLFGLLIAVATAGYKVGGGKWPWQ